MNAYRFIGLLKEAAIQIQLTINTGKPKTGFKSRRKFKFMVKPIPFNHEGEMLWINIEMTGLYFITYTYQLWSASTSTPPILTNPLKSGSNEIPHDDFHPVINDYNPTEAIRNYVNRTIDVRFWVKKGDDDNGYQLKVTVFQGPTFSGAQEIGHDVIAGQAGPLSIKEEFITLKLV